MYTSRPRAAAVEWLCAGLIGLAAGAVVVWHASRAVALWDLSYVLEHAYRIALGDVPYRDFVIPHAPLTFLVQAALIRAFNSGLEPNIYYCALVAGVTAWLTFRIVGQQCAALGIARPWLLAVLALPVVFLNGYGIFSQPFYDPDCVCVVLLATYLLLPNRLGGRPVWRPAAGGALLVVSVFFKQNIGAAACTAVYAGLVAAALGDRTGGGPRRTLAASLLGSSAAVGIAAVVVAASVGLPAYIHWTVTFAASRRWPAPGLVWSWYGYARTWITPACALCGYLLVRRRAAPRWVALAGLMVIALPFADATHTMWRYGLSARSYCFWALGAIVGSVAAVADGRRRAWALDSTLPLVAMVIAHGAFMSQGLFDSAYAVWPLLTIAVTPLAIRILDAAADTDRPAVVAFVVAASGLLCVLGARHVARDERLGFVDLNGAVEAATLPTLRGLATPGTYVADFERLVRRANDLIPAGDGVVVVPGEDPFFLASRRRPQFPVVLFDDTVTPFGPGELMQLLTDRGIKWVIVKDRLQLLHSPWTPLASFVARDLPAAYDVAEVLPRYTIMRRRP